VPFCAKPCHCFGLGWQKFVHFASKHLRYKKYKCTSCDVDFTKSNTTTAMSSYIAFRSNGTSMSLHTVIVDAASTSHHSFSKPWHRSHGIWVCKINVAHTYNSSECSLFANHTPSLLCSIQVKSIAAHR
jgi:hypothetical protein